MTYLCYQPKNTIPRTRIMVIGQDVITVQRVSRYCLERGAEVFPYYGVPTDEEVSLFDPEVSMLCVPIPESFVCHLNQRYVFWSEQPLLIDLPLVSSIIELESCLQLPCIDLN